MCADWCAYLKLYHDQDILEGNKEAIEGILLGEENLAHLKTILPLQVQLFAYVVQICSRGFYVFIIFTKLLQDGTLSSIYYHI